jgi:hypothetical protein
MILSTERDGLKGEVKSRIGGRNSPAVLDRFVDLLLAEVDFNQSLASHQNLLLPGSDSIDMFHHLNLGRT